MDKRVRSFIGLCQKAGKLSFGEAGCEAALKSSQSKLIIICSDASDGTRTKFEKKAFFYEVPVLVYGSSEELSAATGKPNRMTVSVNDEGFAAKLSELILKDMGRNDIKTQ